MEQAFAEELKVAQEAARAAGRYLRAAQGASAIVKQPHGEGYLDVTTEADLEAERIVLAAIAAAFPQDRIVSEETHSAYSAEWERVWIVDPLDGTTNYVKGLDAYAVSVAFALRGRVVAAAVHLPMRDELLHAVRGGGVHSNDAPLVLAGKDDTLAQSLVSVGFPHARTPEAAAQAFDLYRRLWLGSSDLRRSASAVFDGCLLAAGSTGAYATPDIKPWDIAAASLFVEEQGGIATDLFGEPLDLFRRAGERFSTSALFAKNAAIHAEAVRIAGVSRRQE